MKRGERVNILDHSYSLSVEEGMIVERSAFGGYHNNDELYFVCNGKFPTDNFTPFLHSRPEIVNNAMVYNATKKCYFFTQEKFLRVFQPLKFCECCRQRI